jgi:RNA polymerase sigma factor (sigma-70 family)
LADAQLLARFATGRDESAFAEILARHGPLVLGLCRRSLGRHDAEDAFQATFLVLARRAGSIGQGERLAGWLCRVACRIATRMRRQQAVRRRHEQSAVPPAAPPGPSDACLAVLDEVQRLPARYRNLLVLCYLEGNSHPEAARALGVPLGTVKGWLARARGLLRKRLARRGVRLSAGLLAAGAGALPADLSAATVRVAVPTASPGPGGGRSPDRPIELAEEVLRAMRRAKLQLVGAVVLALALFGIGAVAIAYQADTASAAKKAKGDEASIQGTWRVVKLEMEGEEKDDDEAKRMKKATWVITAGKIVVKKPGADEDGEVTYKLYPDRKPKAIDVTPQNGPPREKGKLVKAVYELKGDELTICMTAPPGEDRPDAVSTKRGSRTMLMVLKREKAKK